MTREEAAGILEGVIRDSYNLFPKLDNALKVAISELRKTTETPWTYSNYRTTRWKTVKNWVYYEIGNFKSRLDDDVW